MVVFFVAVIFLTFTSIGGTTKFYETDPLQTVSGDTEALLQVAPKVNLIPKTGTLVIFNHDALHEGTPTPLFPLSLVMLCADHTLLLPCLALSLP